MVKKEKIQKNNFGRKVLIAPAIMVGSLGLCLACLAYLNMSNLNYNRLVDQKVLGVNSAKHADNTESTGNTADNADITFWQRIVEENPTYRDGWIRLAVGYYEDGDIDKAIEALDKAKEIDPNNETVKSLEKIIQK